jgi:hypothetical protein
MQFFIIYVPSQQLQGQLQAQYSAVVGNYITDTHDIMWNVTYMNT